jgi:acyl-CoA hydrolase
MQTIQTVGHTRTESSEIILPGDLNNLGFLFGGRMVSMIDKVAAIAALKHVRAVVVTLAIDSLTFKQPVKGGAIVTLKSCVNRVFKHSLEVGVVAETLNPGEDDSQRVCTAYLTFVALDAEGHPKNISPIVVETPQEQRRFDEALIRRNHRLRLSHELGKSEKAE